MAYEIIFKSTQTTGCKTLLKCGIKPDEDLQLKEMFVTIIESDNSNGITITLNRADAVKLAKEIRKNVSFLEG